MNDSGVQCCFCGKSISCDTIDPYNITIVVNSQLNRAVVDPAEQFFWSHYECFKQKINRKIYNLEACTTSEVISSQCVPNHINGLSDLLIAYTVTVYWPEPTGTFFVTIDIRKLRVTFFIADNTCVPVAVLNFNVSPVDTQTIAKFDVKAVSATIECLKKSIAEHHFPNEIIQSDQAVCVLLEKTHLDQFSISSMRSSLQALGTTCCFCGETIEETITDPCSVVTITSSEIKKQFRDQVQQFFWSHFLCFQKTLQDGIQELLIDPSIE